MISQCFLPRSGRRTSSRRMTYHSVTGLLLLLVASTQEEHPYTRIDFEYQPGLGAIDPPMWAEKYPTCGGKQQSPVDLPDTEETICQPPFRFRNLFEEPNGIELIHMLHTPLIKYHSEKPISVSGGPLQGSYHFDHYLVRWGVDSSHGSEHTLSGRGFAGELQLVFFKNTSSGFHEAVEEEDGIAIFSVWLEEVRKPDNTFFDEMLGMLDYVTQPWSYTNLCEMIPLKYYLPDDHRVYWTYKGSLTYPPCPETAVWIVFNETNPISKYQLLKLRRMIGVRGSISSNVRPVQCRDASEIKKVSSPPICQGEES